MEKISDSTEICTIIGSKGNVKYWQNLAMGYDFRYFSSPSAGLGIRLETEHVTLRSVNNSDEMLWGVVQMVSDCPDSVVSDKFEEVPRDLYTANLDYWLNLRQKNNPLHPLIVENANKELIAVIYVDGKKLHYSVIDLPANWKKGGLRLQCHITAAHLMYAIILPSIITQSALAEEEESAFKLEDPIDIIKFTNKQGFAGRIKAGIDAIVDPKAEEGVSFFDAYKGIKEFSMTATDLVELNWNATQNISARKYLDLLEQNTKKDTALATNSVFRQEDDQDNSSTISTLTNDSVSGAKV